MLLAACGSSPQPTPTGPLLRAEKAGGFSDSEAPARQAAFTSGDDGVVTLWKLRIGTG